MLVTLIGTLACCNTITLYSCSLGSEGKAGHFRAGQTNVVASLRAAIRRLSCAGSLDAAVRLVVRAYSCRRHLRPECRLFKFPPRRGLAQANETGSVATASVEGCG